MIRCVPTLFGSLILLTMTNAQGRPPLPLSPTPLVRVTAAIPNNLPQFDAGVVQKFHPYAFLLTNESNKTIVGLMTLWTFTDANGFPRTGEIHTDSFMQPHSPALLAPQSSLIVAPGAFLPVALANRPHLGATLTDLDGRLSPAIIGATNIKVEIDLVIFDDGEIAGPNATRFDTQIQDRKIAATLLAKQIRNTIANADDPNTVLSNVLETKPAQSDPVAMWTHMYARMLFKSRSLDKQLNALETLPEPPTFYKKKVQ